MNKRASRGRTALSMPAAVALLASTLAAAAGGAATITVNSTADPGDGVCDATECTLREAIDGSAAADTIDFDVVLPATVTLTAGQLFLGHEISIIGPGADRLAVSGGDTHRVFFVDSFVPVLLQGLTIRDGRSDDSNGRHSAGIRNFGYLTVVSCAIVDNESVSDNGGIGTSRRLTLIDSLVANNVAAGTAAGGIGSDAELIVINSTISGNTAGNHAGGIKANKGFSPTRFVMLNSTVVGNLSGANSGNGILINTPTTLGNNIILGNGAQDCSDGRSDTVSLGHSFVGSGCPTSGAGDFAVASGDVFTTVLDQSLADNGGATPTHALLPGSPAIDGGDPSGCRNDLDDPIPTDQRGVPRPHDGDGDGVAVCDSGAYEAAPVDGDGDGVADIDDNCPEAANPEQTDTDLDGTGDACDDDDDNDGAPDPDDNCPFTANPSQTDSDGDGDGNACDVDLDGDGICEGAILQGGCSGVADNCPAIPNPFQDDTDSDGSGDACDDDDDNDGVCDTGTAAAGCDPGPDNCPTLVNADQADLDGDGIGDACDADLDGDGICEGPDPLVGTCAVGGDNCPATANPDQNDTDGDGDGDTCDADDDGDGVADGADNCQFLANPAQEDLDGDGDGDACDADLDGDGVDNQLDNCPQHPNSNQTDLDGDALGDACDPDIDGDGVNNGDDLCAGTFLGELVDPASGCSLAQLCPCSGPRGTNRAWKNHGKYVSCVAHAAEEFVAAGLVSEAEKDTTVSEAASSSCGHRG